MSSRTLIQRFSYTGRLEVVFQGTRAQGWEDSGSLMDASVVSRASRPAAVLVVPLVSPRYNRFAVLLVPEPSSVKVILRNPKREVEISGKRRVKELLIELDLLPGTVLVIRGDELLTSDAVVGDDDVLEVRPVMSGGSAEGASGGAGAMPATGARGLR